ncbi:MAG: serine hydrolase [Symploca sp. SIO2E6]|nr:serine hydrolase [Symploca sp. SIO2E6]
MQMGRRGDGEMGRMNIPPKTSLTPPSVQLPPYPQSGSRPKGHQIPGRQLPPTVKPATDARKRRREYNKLRTTRTAVASSPRGTTRAQPNQQQSYPQATQRQKSSKGRRPLKRPVSSLVYLVRMVIVGIGIGAIAGTILSTLSPSDQTAVKTNDQAKTQIQETPTAASSSLPLSLRQEIPTLKTKMQTLVAQNPNLQPGVFIIDLDTGAYLDWQGSASFSAASTIKVPILVAFFQDIDAGKIRLDEPLILQQNLIAGGSGDLQYQQPGSQYTALEVVTKMIAISDNTATNMIIARLGGPNALNQRFATWGLKATAIRNPLPDLEGTNTTSPRDLADLMSVVNQGKLMSLRSRDRLLDIMQQTETNTMLPQGLGPGATIAHKTGNIGSVLADVGLVDMPTGKRYIVVAMVKRPHNDDSAEELIRQISSVTYEYFNQPRATPSTTSKPSENTAILTRIPTFNDNKPSNNNNVPKKLSKKLQG